MDEALPVDHQADVIGVGSGLEEHHVTRLQPATGYGFGGALLGGGGARDRESGLMMGVMRQTAAIEALGGRALALPGDVTQADNLATAIATLEKELGPLSVCGNCAGIANATAAEEMPLSQWQRTGSGVTFTNCI